MNFDLLNEDQIKAVKYVNSSLKIVAGPGSGKTRTIIAKIIYILENQLATPDDLLVFAFTNKAVNEIKKRVKDSTSFEVKNIFTFHAWAVSFLRKEANRINLNSNFKIIDTYDQKTIIKNIIKNKSNDLEGIEIKDFFKKLPLYKYKEEILEEDRKSEGYEKDLVNLYFLYNETKNTSNFFDFDDLLIKVNFFLKKYKEVFQTYNSKYKYIFVDEFQDTNKIQYDILKSITNKNTIVTIVGDPDQNIYSWRGANIKYMLNFEKDFPNTKTIILRKNYRSSKNIIDVSNLLIKNNKTRISFDFESVKSSGNEVKVIEGFSQQHEAEMVIKKILDLKSQGIKLHDIAIIYRANYVSRPFETELIKWKIPYVLVGGFRFFERKEVKDVLNFYSFLIFQDNFSLSNIINIPAKGIGARTIEKINMLSKKYTLTFWEVINSDYFSSSTPLKEFIKISKKYIDKLRNSTINHSLSILEEYLEEINFINYYRNIENKLENVYSLFEQLKSMIKKSVDYNELFNSIAIYSTSDKNYQNKHITLITSHASKGLEFKVVFFVGVNEGIIPSYRSKTNLELEEERRVAYVTITRAEDLLYLSYSRGPSFIPGKELRESMFIYEIKNKLNFSNIKLNNIINLPKQQSLNNKNLFKNDIIVHNKLGEGKIISVEGKYIKVKFKNISAVQELSIGIPSYYKKEE